VRLRFEIYNEKDERAGYALVEPEGPYLRLVWISVYEKDRGRGYGTRLIERVKAYAKSRGFIEVVGCLDLNPEGFKERKRFFEKFGRLAFSNGALHFFIPL